MKTLFSCRQISVWLLAGSFSLLPFADYASAAGGGGAGAAGGSGVGGSAAGVGGGGGHGGGAGISSGGGHAGAAGLSSGGHLGGAGFVGGTRGFGGPGGGQHVSAGFSSGHQGGLIPTGVPFGGNAGANYRSAAYGNRTVGIGGNQRAYNRGYQVSSIGNRAAVSSLNTSRVRNAWTEPNNAHVNPAARMARYGNNGGAYDEDRSVLQTRLSTGQHLYPGASNYSAVTANGQTRALQGSGNLGNNRGGLRNYNRGTRDAYNRFYFTSAFFPYLYGSFFPAYYGYYGNGYLGGGFGDYLDNGDASLNSNYGSPNFNEATVPYTLTDGTQYNNGPANSDPQSTPPTDDNTLPPNQPSSVGPQSPAPSEERESRETGPDTLVESVQNELAKRGYYGDSIDSMYNDATRTALRRFQTDQHLAVTGRINEATLHALQLD